MPLDLNVGRGGAIPPLPHMSSRNFSAGRAVNFMLLSDFNIIVSKDFKLQINLTLRES
jgi:hypothetical protein